MRGIALRTLWIAASWPLVAHADAPANGVAITTMPLPVRDYFRVDPSYTFVDDGGDEGEVLVRGVFVYRGWLIPGLGPATAASAMRVELTIDRVATPTGHVVGLGKLQLGQVSGVTFGWGSAGVGFAMALPTQTSTAIAAGDVQAGPAGYGYLSAIPDLPCSLIVRTLFATGSSPPIVTTFEPTVALELGDTFALLSDAIIDVDWLAPDSRVPVNLHVGYTLGDHWYFETGPEIVVAGSRRGDIAIDLEVDYFL